MAPNLLARLFGPRETQQRGGDDGMSDTTAILRRHVLLEFTQGQVGTGDGVVLGRSHGVNVTLHDCAGGNCIDPLSKRDGEGFYRCQICERLFVVRYGIESRKPADPAAPAATKEDADGSQN